MKDLVRGARAP